MRGLEKMTYYISHKRSGDLQGSMRNWKKENLLFSIAVSLNHPSTRSSIMFLFKLRASKRGYIYDIFVCS